jgi:mannosyltransferase
VDSPVRGRGWGTRPGEDRGHALSYGTAERARRVRAEFTPEHDRLAVVALLLGIFFLGMALRLHDLDGDSLWYDEILTITTSALDLRSIIQFQLADKVGVAHPPLLYIITHFFVATLGRSDFVARLPALLFGSLSILLIYKAGELLWGWKEGLLGAFLLSVNAYHVRYSQEARHYGLMVFLALLSLIFLLAALQKRQARFWIAFVLCSALSLYNHYFGLAVLAAETLFAAFVITADWLSSKKEVAGGSVTDERGALSAPAWQAVALCLSLAVIAVSFVPWLSVLRSQIPGVQTGLPGGPTLNPGFSLSFLSRVINSYGSGVDSGNVRPETATLDPIFSEGPLSVPVWQNAAVLVALALFLVGIVTSGRRQALLAASWAGSPFVLLAVVEPETFIHARHVLFILPIYLLVIAKGTTSLSRLVGVVSDARRRDRRSRLVLASTCLLIGVTSLLPLQEYYRSNKEDWREAALYLKENAHSGDLILADSKAQRGGAAKAKLGLSYYLNPSDGPKMPILLVERGLWQELEGIDRGKEAGVWTVLEWRGSVPRSRALACVGFHHVLIARLTQRSGNVLQDTLSMLKALLDVLPNPDARFDIHLALAEIYLQTGGLEEAAWHLHQASLVRPDDPAAAHDIAGLRSELAEQSHLASPDIQYPLWRNLGGMIALIGDDISPTSVQSGEGLRVTARWQALAEMDKDYSLFIHVVGEDEHIWAQRDLLLQHDDHPTSKWPPGEVVAQEYELELPPDVPPGEYDVKIGLYYWKTGERVRVWDERGERVADDAILLRTPLVIR